MSNLAEYKKLLLESLHARASGDGHGEDKILDILDRLWYRMSKEEMDAANEWTAALSKTHLDDKGNVITPLPEIP